MLKTSMPAGSVASWTDEKTGRRIRQLTNLPGGAKLNYFRVAKMLSDGRLVGNAQHGRPELLLVEPDSGDVETIVVRNESGEPIRSEDWLRAGFETAVVVDAATNNLAMLGSKERRSVWRVSLNDGVMRFVGKLPDDVPGRIHQIRPHRPQVIGLEVHQDSNHWRDTDDAASLLAWLRRPRRGRLFLYDFETGENRTLLETDGILPSHVELSLTDPDLLRFCHDRIETECQRIWTLRLDDRAAKPKAIRVQEPGEMVTHEFWWPGGKMIGYTYQDRRNDDTKERLPWAEYAPVTSHLGIADLDGREVYCSAPLNTYHTHLYVSPDGNYVCGEGTDGNCFVQAAKFSLDEKRVDLMKLATVHTPYQAFTGQKVDCNFSRDSRWLVYNDTIDGVYQICAVEVDL
jgi:hypothetical protein